MPGLTRRELLQRAKIHHNRWFCCAGELTARHAVADREGLPSGRA